ncbi:MAG: hypothetical protein SCARUB_02852 [Candidatus Scalindua rubra]|uniref:BEACH domain-containing protein n=1 Tax=Candidatus Scalindua rubra TaxID=1872076 RepID=A0A1E3X8U7_9BACT|nr:MAG: hypothetical protein SCARUB_02852 [Candidatus Scalindua rubra]
MRLFVTTTFFIILIMLCNRNTAQGTLITKDVSQHPIHISASNIMTWQRNGTRIFSVEGNVKIEQGDVQITTNSAITWFSEIKITQFTEGYMEIYCEGNVSLFQDETIQNYEQMYLKLITTAGVVIDPIDTSIQSFEEEKKTELYFRGEKIRAEGREEFASKEVPKAGLPTSVSVEGEPIDIFADDIDTWIEKDVRIIVAIGNVRIKRGNETLNADNIILYFDQEKGEKDKSPKQIYKEVYAEGNVTLRRESDVIIAERMFENVKEKKGISINSVFRTSITKEGISEKEKREPYHRDFKKEDKKRNEDEAGIPVYIGGDEIKHRGKGQYDMKNGFFSICSYGHPHFRFQSSNLRLFKTEQHSIVTAQKNTFYAGNIPLMHFPFNLSFDANRRSSFLKDWDIGRTSRFGPFIKTDWDIYSFAFAEKMGDWSDLTLSLDYLEKRGPAVGLDFEYTKPDYSGNMNTYYINDSEDTDVNNVPVEDDNRGHFLWRHRQFLANNWRADIEISHVADRSYYREFYESEFKQEKDKETMIYLRKIYDNKGITFLANKQLRDFDTLVDSQRLNRTNETLPELKYRIIGEPLWGDRLNFTSETELAYHDRVIDRIPPKKAEEQFLGRGALLTAERVFDRGPVRFEPKETIRFDTNNTLNAPFRLFSQRFNPFVGIRFTGYSESVKEDPVTQRNEGDGTARGRIALPLGFNTSTTLSRTYSIYNKFLNINRLRHILIPEARFVFIPLITQNPEDLNQFDGIDSLDTYQSIVLGVRNRFQTKQGETGGETPVDFADFDIEFNFFPGNSGLNRKLDDFIKLDLKLKLSDRLSFLSENNEYNLGKGSFDVVNFGLGYDYMPKWNIFIGNRFIDDISSSLVLSSEYFLSEKWRVGFFEQFDFKSRQRDEAGRGIRDESQNLSTKFVLSRFFMNS